MNLLSKIKVLRDEKTIIKVGKLKEAFSYEYFDPKSKKQIAIFHGVNMKNRQQYVDANLDNNCIFAFGEAEDDRVIKSANSVGSAFLFFSDDEVLRSKVEIIVDCEKTSSLTSSLSNKFPSNHRILINKILKAGGLELFSLREKNELIVLKVLDKEKNKYFTVEFRNELLTALYRNSLNEDCDSFFEKLESDPWQIKKANGNVDLKSIQQMNSYVWKEFGFARQGALEWRKLDIENSDNPVFLYNARAKYAIASGVIDSSVKTDFKKAILGCSFAETSLYNPFFRHIWNVEGTTFEARELLMSMIQTNKLSAVQLMAAASFFCNAGEQELGLKLAFQAKKKDKDSWEKNRYLGLTSLLVSEGKLSSQWGKNDALIYSHLKRNEGKFESLIKDNKDSYAIIGNSPLQIGQKKGDLIDSKNIVVRFNSAPISSDFMVDYGEKHNVWFVNGKHYDVKRQPYRPNVELIVLSASEALYMHNNAFARLRDYIEQYEVQLVPDIYRRQVIEEVNTNPSAGLVALKWTHTLVGNLKDQENIFGFSLTDQQEKTTSHYYEKGLVKSRNTHEWSAERKLFDALVAPGNCV